MISDKSDAGQSNVIGVALLLGITVVSMGTLTAAVGVLVDANAAQADAERVTADFDRTFDPVIESGSGQGTVMFGEGSLRSVNRTIEVRTDVTMAEGIDANALVFESSDRRVAYYAGAIVRGGPGWAWMESKPPITVDDELIIVGVPRLGPAPGGVAGGGGVTAVIETEVEHERYELGETTLSIAVETKTPEVWERYFRDVGAVVDREDDDIPVVVATFDGDRTGYLVVHDLNAEVSDGV